MKEHELEAKVVGSSKTVTCSVEYFVAHSDELELVDEKDAEKVKAFEPRKNSALTQQDKERALGDNKLAKAHDKAVKAKKPKSPSSD